MDALRSGGVAAVRRQAERLGGVDAALPLGCRLIEIAVTFGDVESRAYLLDANASPAEALRIAAQNGHVAALEYLLDRLAPDLDAADEDGNTLLAYAALSGNADVVQVLLRAGADTATRRP